jgi:hypothetical protein
MERECLRVHGVRGEPRPQVFCSMCLMSFPVNATAIAPITATRKWANFCATNTSLLQDLAGAVVGTTVKIPAAHRASLLRSDKRAA